MTENPTTEACRDVKNYIAAKQKPNPIAEPLAEVTRRGSLSMQVCVPADWSDDKVKTFADRANLCGTENGWFVRKEAPERVACDARPGFVHIVLDA